MDTPLTALAGRVKEYQKIVAEHDSLSKQIKDLQAQAGKLVAQREKFTRESEAAHAQLRTAGMPLKVKGVVLYPSMNKEDMLAALSGAEATEVDGKGPDSR